MPIRQMLQPSFGLKNSYSVMMSRSGSDNRVEQNRRQNNRDIIEPVIAEGAAIGPFCSGSRYANLSAEPVALIENNSSDRPHAALLTVAATAKILTISATAVRRLQQARKLPFVKIGGSVRFLGSDLMAYLKKQRVRSIDK